MPGGLVTFLLPTWQEGGAERNVVALANELSRRRRPVEIVVGDDTGPLRRRVAAGVPVATLGSPRLRWGLPPLVRHLRAHRPEILLTTVGHANMLGLVARRVARVDSRVVIRVETNLGVTDEGGARQRALRRLARTLYRRADGLVANSAGSARDLATFLAIDPARVAVLPNATVGAELFDLAARPVGDPWLADDALPVVLTVGRLVPAKNHHLLVEAFARVRRRRPARLLILGDGPERGSLVELAGRLGVGDDVRLPGHVDNPFAYMRQAAVFCLSSRREGMPNALIEALACGASVVSTDCPSGPGELLQQGRFGRLVPTDDPRALAAALEAALDDPRPAPPEAWRRHTTVGAADAYERYLEGLRVDRGERP